MVAARYQEVCSKLAAEPKHWLVTGAAGFIGSALVEQLLALGQTVRGLDNFSTGCQENLDQVTRSAADGQFAFIKGDIENFDTCLTAAKSVDVVLHQAALGSVPRSIDAPVASHRANVDGFVHMALAAREAGVKRFVYASSSSVYGGHPGLPKREGTEGRALSPYAATKQINELYAHVFQLTYDLEFVGLRYFNVFGRRQSPNGPYAAVIPRWLESLLKGEPSTIFGDGTNSRDFCYVDNAVQANILGAVGPSEATGKVYNVGCGGRTDLSALYSLLQQRSAGYVSGARDLKPHHAAPRPGDVPHSQADISLIREQLGYDPSHQVAEGLTETVRWFAEARGLTSSS